MNEQISKWIDGDLPDDEAELAMRRCLQSEDARITFAAYHAIGDVLRHGSGAGRDRTQAIFAALASEPTLLVPGASLRIGEERAQQAARRPLTESTRFRVGFAAAASVATIAAVGWIGFTDRAPAEMQAATKSSPVDRQLMPAPAAAVAMPAHVQDYMAVHRQFSNPDAVIQAAHTRNAASLR